MFCRVAAKELSVLAPHLAKANVRLIGIGLEELGVQEFMEGKFFDGGEFCVVAETGLCTYLTYLLLRKLLF